MTFLIKLFIQLITVNNTCHTSSGYSYDPAALAKQGIRVFIFGWEDFGVPKMPIAFEMVKVGLILSVQMFLVNVDGLCLSIAIHRYLVVCFLSRDVYECML